MGTGLYNEQWTVCTQCELFCTKKAQWDNNKGFKWSVALVIYWLKASN